MGELSRNETHTIQQLAEFFSDSLETILVIDRFDKTTLQTTGINYNKIICEICLFFHFAHKFIVESEVLRNKVECFVIKSSEHVLDRNIISYIERFPSGVHLVGLILLCANTYKLKAKNLRLLEQAILSPAYLCAERMPFRHQEAVWLYEQITGEILAKQHCCQSALFSRIGHPCVLKRDDLYAKTHTVMYESNFGRRKICELYNNNEIKLNLCHDLNFCFCNADWDLVGEICMANQFADNPQLSNIQCINALHAIFLKFGFIPSITFDADCAEKLCGKDLELYKFAHSYHSTLVYGLLLACSEGNAERIDYMYDDDVQAYEMLAAIGQFFGHREFDLGPLSEDWYAAELEVSFEALIDGYASKCYSMLGRQRAITFIDSISGAKDMKLVKHTREYFERI